MIEGAAILAIGMLIGWVAGRVGRRRRRQVAPGPPAPICTCDHTRGEHVDGTGRCHGKVKRPIYRKGGFDHHEYVDCDCQMYHGPEPMPDYFAQEIQP